MHLIGIVYIGVKKQVYCHPSRAGLYTEGLQGPVKVFGTIHMPRVTQVVVVLGGTGGAKTIVSPTGIADKLDQGLEILGIKFCQ